jgi:hypothetical protein
MIDLDIFEEEWTALAGRFGKANDKEQGAAYYVFLSERMQTEDFVAAARTLWADARWFPRPVDFLLVGTSDHWRTVLQCMDLSYEKKAWHEEYANLPQRARDACMALGGVPQMKYMYDKDSIRTKTEWERAVEQTTSGEVLRLESGTQRRRLSEAPAVRTLAPIHAVLPQRTADEEG